MTKIIWFLLNRQVRSWCEVVNIEHSRLEVEVACASLILILIEIPGISYTVSWLSVSVINFQHQVTLAFGNASSLSLLVEGLLGGFVVIHEVVRISLPLPRVPSLPYGRSVEYPRTNYFPATWPIFSHVTCPLKLCFLSITCTVRECVVLTFRNFGGTQGVLWPVFHHVVDVYGDLVMRFFNQDTLADLWQCYANVNRRFRDRIVEVCSTSSWYI